MQDSDLEKAVLHIKKNHEIRLDQLNSFGITEDQLRIALEKNRLSFTTKDYSDDPFGNHPSEIYLDLIELYEDEGPGGIDY